MSTILTLGYSGSLISFLTIKVIPKPFDQVEQLALLPKSTKIGTYGFGVDMGKFERVMIYRYAHWKPRGNLFY